MDHPDRFPRSILDICEEDDIDILVWVVTNHIAHASVVALFLCEHDISGPINGELYPISVHLLPVILHVVEHLGSEKCCLYWLLSTSIREIDNLGFHHPPLYLCHVVLSH